VFEQHAVWENLELAMKADKRWWSSLRARLTRRASTHRGNAGADRARGRSLSAGRLAVAWPEAAARDRHAADAAAQLLLLDEPVAGMTDDETMQLAALLNSCAAAAR
jgi:urea transport system ATP-binding protein